MPDARHAGPLGDDIRFDPPPASCPACGVPLGKSYPQCPACGEPLSPQRLKARAEAAVARGLGFGPPGAPPPDPLKEPEP